MTEQQKQTLLKAVAVFVFGFMLGVWVASPRPKAPVERMRDVVRAQAEETDSWLEEMDRELRKTGEPSGSRSE